MSSLFFTQRFEAQPSSEVFVPGRVNLIGEHIDYNGGLVLPFALRRGVTVALGRRSDDQWTVVSDRYSDDYCGAPGNDAEGWARHPVAALQMARDRGWLKSGYRVAITSDLPDGAGVSSSAALIVALLKAIRAQEGLDLTDTEVAVAARCVETDYLGVPVGIMDQMAVAIASPGEAILLDTKTLSYKSRDLPGDLVFVTLHSGIRRELSDGRYRVRKEECDQAKQYFCTDDLCRIDLAQLTGATDLPEVVRRRVRHCITEHERVKLASEALGQRDHQQLGDLMNASHRSMREDFEVSVPGVDALVETALREGALGARLTGGGFGGCVVAAVPTPDAQAWQDRVLKQHPDAFSVEDF